LPLDGKSNESLEGPSTCNGTTVGSEDVPRSEGSIDGIAGEASKGVALGASSDVGFGVSSLDGDEG